MPTVSNVAIIAVIILASMFGAVVLLAMVRTARALQRMDLYPWAERTSEEHATQVDTKPCSFCACVPSVRKMRGNWIVTCAKCSISMWDSTADEAIATWNRFTEVIAVLQTHEKTEAE